LQLDAFQQRAIVGDVRVAQGGPRFLTRGVQRGGGERRGIAGRIGGGAIEAVEAGGGRDQQNRLGRAFDVQAVAVDA
jgi:hypothetical protein